MPLLTGTTTSLYYELHGSGPPLLLVAGLASDSQSWLPVVPGLAERFTVIVFDNRGVGRSDQTAEISIGLMADDCSALINHLGFDRVHLLGHSMGGMVAMEAALRAPQRFQTLQLVATAARNSERNNRLFQAWADDLEAGADRAVWFRTLVDWIFTKRLLQQTVVVDEMIGYLLQYPWPQSAAAFAKQVRAIADFDAGDQLQGICLPSCVIAGEQDRLMPLAESEYLSQQIPGARLQVIRNTAHSVHTEQPDAFATCVIEFCDHYS